MCTNTVVMQIHQPDSERLEYVLSTMVRPKEYLTITKANFGKTSGGKDEKLVKFEHVSSIEAYVHILCR